MLLQKFKNPDNTDGILPYGTLPLWCLNDKLSKEELSRQIDLMAEKGIRGFFIFPMYVAEYDESTIYLTEEWWDICSFILQRAREENMEVWIYDEENWPSGTAGTRVTRDKEFVEKYLDYEIIDLSGAKEIVLKGKEPFFARAYRRKGSEILIETGRDLSGFVKDGILRTDRNTGGKPDGLSGFDCAVLFYLRTEEKYGSISVDYLNKRAIRMFIDLTYEAYYSHLKKHFGNTLKGFFYDEPRFANAIPWTAKLPAIFETKKGYGLMKYLPGIVADIGRPTAKFRYDYYDVLSELYVKSFVGQIYKWCRKRGIPFTGHPMAEESLNGNVRYTGNLFRILKETDYPGVDYLGRGTGGVHLKVCSSVAHLMNKKRVMCEGFGGSGWDCTYEDVINMTNYFYSQGINLMVPCRFDYSSRGPRVDVWPPSFFYQWRDWDKYGEYTEYVSRLSWMLSGVKHINNIVVYYPIETVWAHYLPDITKKLSQFVDGAKIRDEVAFSTDKSYQDIANNLMANQIDFDFIDSEFLIDSNIVHGRIIPKGSKGKYRVLILPGALVLGKKTLEAVAKFADTGGIVIFYKGAPEQEAGMESGDRIKKILNRIKHKVIFADTVDEVIGTIRQKGFSDIEFEGDRKAIKGNVNRFYDTVHDPFMHGGEEKRGIVYCHYFKMRHHIYFIANLNLESIDFTVTVPDYGKPEIWNPVDGSVKKKIKYSAVGDKLQIPLTMNSNSSLFLVM